MNTFGITERGDAGLDRMWEAQASRHIGVILITKAPQALAETSIPENAIIHCTITGFGSTALEPGVVPAKSALSGYRRLVNLLGPERTVLRIDPIIPTRKGLKVAQDIFAQRQGRTRISFIDAYAHVQRRFKAAGLPALEPQNGSIHYPLKTRLDALSLFPGTEVCSEPGLPCSGCISDLDYRALNLTPPTTSKLKGQRSSCLCLSSKTELLKNRGQCAHGCIYCYWR